MHPVLWSWGPVTLYTYGVMLAIAVLAAMQLARRRAVAAQVPTDRIMDLCLITLLGGIVGARAVYVAQHWPLYAETPLEILRLDHGGLVYYGGLCGGTAAALLAIARWRWPFWATLDLLVPSVALAQGIGRLGCFFNGCCYGKRAYLPWAVRYPFLPYPVHPVQIYEAVFNVTAFFFLLALHARKRFHGETTIAYLIIYAVGRFFLEMYRGDNMPFLWGCTLPQVMSLGFVLFASLLYSLRFRFRKS